MDFKTLPSRRRLNTNLYIAVATALLALISALWQHSSAAAYKIALQTFGKGAVECGIGISAIAIGWAGLSGLMAVGLMHLTALLFFIVMDERTAHQDKGSQQERRLERDGDEA